MTLRRSTLLNLGDLSHDLSTLDVKWSLFYRCNDIFRHDNFNVVVKRISLGSWWVLLSKTRPFLDSLAFGGLAGFPHSNKRRCFSLQLIHCYDLVYFINKASVCWNVVILRTLLLPCIIDVFGSAGGGGVKARGEGDRHPIGGKWEK